MEINDIILSNLLLIEKNIEYRWKNLEESRIEYDDFYQQVMLELIRNYEHFDDYIFTFEGYLNNIIFRVVYRYLFENKYLIKVPIYCRRIVEAIEDITNSCLINNGEYPSIEYLTEVINHYNYAGFEINEKIIERLLVIINNNEIDNYHDYSEEVTNQIVSKENIEDDVVNEILSKDLCEYIKELSPKLGKIYIEYLGLDNNKLTSGEMQRKYKISRQSLHAKIKNMDKKIENNKSKTKKFKY